MEKAKLNLIARCHKGGSLVNALIQAADFVRLHPEIEIHKAVAHTVTDPAKQGEEDLDLDYWVVDLWDGNPEWLILLLKVGDKLIPLPEFEGDARGLPCFVPVDDWLNSAAEILLDRHVPLPSGWRPVLVCNDCWPMGYDVELTTCINCGKPVEGQE